MVKWWDRFWGAVWIGGSLAIAYLTARWLAVDVELPDYGPWRYVLVAFAFLFGLLLGMFGLSVAVIAITTALERLLARLGRPLRRPAAATPEIEAL